MTYELLVLELDPNRRDGEGRLRMDGGVEEEGKMRQGRKNEARQGGGREGRPFERGKHSRRRVPAWLQNDTSLVENKNNFFYGRQVYEYHLIANRLILG